MLVGLGDLVRPQAQHHVLRVGHRRDARRVHRLELRHEREDPVQVLLHRGDLGRGDFEPGELRDPEDVRQIGRAHV